MRHVVGKDIAWRLDIARARSILTAGGYKLCPGILPQSQQQFVLAAPQLTVGSLTTQNAVEITLYDNGSVSIAWTLSSPRELSLDELGASVRELAGNPAFLAEAHRLAGEVAKVLEPALQEVKIRSAAEDHTIVSISLPKGRTVTNYVDSHRAEFARILSTESYELSQSAVDQLLGTAFSFSTSDVILAAWAASVVVAGSEQFIPRTRLADAIALLEYANVQILEFDILEEELESLWQHSEQVLDRDAISDRQIRELAWTANHLAALLQEVRSGLELLDDEMLGMLYEKLAERFRFTLRVQTIEALKAQLDGIFDWSESSRQYRTGHKLEVGVLLLIVLEVLIAAVEFWPTIRTGLHS